MPVFGAHSSDSNLRFDPFPTDGWGKNTVVALPKFIRRHELGAGGFSAQNLWRMRQFFEAGRGFPKLSALPRGLPWTHDLSGG
jgi:hypothetical protein